MTTIATDGKSMAGEPWHERLRRHPARPPRRGPPRSRRDEDEGRHHHPGRDAEREKYATVKGTLIAAGENAWEEAAARSPAFTRPQPGDRIMIAKYGGILFKGADGDDYRIMNDEDVIARLEE
jgi:chaperonin GroES